MPARQPRPAPSGRGGGCEQGAQEGHDRRNLRGARRGRTHRVAQAPVHHDRNRGRRLRACGRSSALDAGKGQGTRTRGRGRAVGARLEGHAPADVRQQRLGRRAQGRRAHAGHSQLLHAHAFRGQKDGRARLQAEGGHRLRTQAPDPVVRILEAPHGGHAHLLRPAPNS